MSVKQRFSKFRHEMQAEFSEYVAPLLSNPNVQRLDDFVHHVNYTRLGHSLDVAYLSFCLAKLSGSDAKSCARAGLLHDMYFYEDHEGKSLAHMKNHPAEALENARTVCTLSAMEEDIILKHMWLVNLAPPRYKESYIVTFVDKACALRERMFGMTVRRNRLRRRRLAAVLQVML